MSSVTSLPVLALTLGDVAGIGPEISVLAIQDTEVQARCRPVLVGCPQVVQRALQRCGLPGSVAEIDLAHEVLPTTADDRVWVWNPSSHPLPFVEPGTVSGVAGRAASDWLCAAGRAALQGKVDGIVTAPLNKLALHAGGVDFPGHTEILGELCGVADVAMMLHLPNTDFGMPPEILSLGPQGLSVAHVTLHTSIASVPGLLTSARITATIELMDRFLKRLGVTQPRIGVAALNPHAGEGGLFGDEESRLIQPALAAANCPHSQIRGPISADALIQQACRGQFYGVIAMYHDQGHIPLKLIGRGRAVNITLGLPIVRTSPSHGTAFDIAWQNRASPAAMIGAINTAIRLVDLPAKSS